MNEQIENWAADFADSTAYATLPDALKEHAVAVCAAFLEAACHSTHPPSAGSLTASTHPDRAPEDLDEEAVRHAMLDHMPELKLSEEVRRGVPEIVSAFLGTLQDAGRLSGGHGLAKQVSVLASAYRERCAPGGGLRTPPARNVAPKISRNDPCPCGSGKKYKKCCGR